MLSALTISGRPSPVELIDAWDEILTEYLTSLGSTEMQHQLSLEKTITLLECKIDIVDMCLARLRHGRSDIAVMELGRLGYRFPFNPNDPAGYEQNLRAVYSRSKTLVMMLEQKKAEYARLEKKASAGKKTRQDFTDDLQVLSRYQGYKILPDSTTLAEFASIYKDYVRYIDNQKTAADGK